MPDDPKIPGNPVPNPPTPCDHEINENGICVKCGKSLLARQPLTIFKS